MAAGRLLARALDLVTLVVLARFLMPEEFGLVAIAVSLVAVMEAMTALSIDAALVRLPSISRSHLHAAFTLNLVRGAVLAAAVAAAALPFGSFYGDERLTTLLFVLSLAPLARSMQSPALSLLSKQMQFGPWFMIDVASRVMALILSASIAMATGSYWAIVAGTLAAPFVSSALSYLYAPYRPGLSLRKVGSLWDFLGWLSLAQFMSALNWQYDRFFLGRVVPFDILGTYNVANNLASLPEQSIVRSVVAPLLSGFVHIRDDINKLREAYYKADAALFTVGSAILVGIAVFADPLVRLLFEEGWAPMIPLLQGLSIAFIPSLQRIAFRALAMAMNRTVLLAQAMTMSLLLKVAAVTAGFYAFGMGGVVLGIGVASAATAAIFMAYAKVLVGAPIIKQIGSSWRPACAAIVMAATGALTAPWLAAVEGVALAALLALAALAAYAAYTVVLFGLWHARGRPAGLERQIVEALAALIKRHV